MPPHPLPPPSRASVFVAGGGAMGERLRAFDWAATPLGPLAQWSDTLRIAVDQLMGSRFPACLCWGASLITIYNDGFRPILGAKPEALGRSFREVWAEVWDGLEPVAQRALNGEATYIEDHRLEVLRHGHLEEAFFTFCYSPVFDARGQVVGMLDTVVETTSKVHAIRRAHAERERQQRLLTQMPGFVCVVMGPEHRFDYFNNAFRAIAGERDLQGLPVREAFPDLAGQGYFELMDRAYVSGEPMTAAGLPIRFDRADGERFIDVLYEPMRDTRGQVQGLFIAGYDVTARMSAEAALLATQQRLHATTEAALLERTEERDAAQAALRQAQKMEAVGQLTGGIAHDFNNLLGAISGSLEVLKTRLARGQTDNLGRYIEMGENAVRRAAALTHRLLAFSRQQTLDPQPTDVNALVHGMEELIRRSLGPDMTLQFTLGEDLWPTRIDAPQLESALLNLCINGRDAMTPQGGRLSIRTGNVQLAGAHAQAIGAREGDYVRISVADTGTGIAAQHLDRIFDPFFTTKPTGQGTGLGLSMVYGFVHQSEGHIAVDSQPGRGTTMQLYLPRHEGSADAPPQADAARPLAAGAGQRVMLVEDEADLRRLLAEVLSDAGYRVRVATHGPQALRQLEAADADIDLLVTDVGLPGGLNGRQLADRVRRLRPGLPVLFITGYAEKAAVGNGLMEPGMQVITKPFDLGLFMDRVAAMLTDGR